MTSAKQAHHFVTQKIKRLAIDLLRATIEAVARKLSVAPEQRGNFTTFACRFLRCRCAHLVCQCIGHQGAEHFAHAVVGLSVAKLVLCAVGAHPRTTVVTELAASRNEFSQLEQVCPSAAPHSAHDRRYLQNWDARNGYSTPSFCSPSLTSATNLYPTPRTFLMQPISPVG